VRHRHPRGADRDRAPFLPGRGGASGTGCRIPAQVAWSGSWMWRTHLGRMPGSLAYPPL